MANFVIAHSTTGHTDVALPGTDAQRESMDIRIIATLTVLDFDGTVTLVPLSWENGYHYGVTPAHVQNITDNIESHGGEVLCVVYGEESRNGYGVVGSPR